MFSNLRLLSNVIFTFSILVMFIFSFYLKSIFLTYSVDKNFEQQANAYNSSYTKLIWNRYSEFITILQQKPQKSWAIFPQYRNFLDETDDFFGTEKILIKVNILGTDGKQVLYESNLEDKVTESSGLFASSNPQEQLNAAIDKAKLSDVGYYISKKSTVKNKKGEYTVSLYNIIIPLKYYQDLSSGVSKDSINGVTTGYIHISFDCSVNLKQIEAIQMTLIIIMSLVLGGIAIILYYTSQKAESLIEKQQELSLDMASAKVTAESESKAKSQFLANVSHELRTPLNAIIGFSEIINSESMGPIGNQQYKEFVQDIHASGVHLLSLINDILDFSKAEEDKLQVELEQVDITKTSKICMRMVTPRAEDAKVVLVEKLPNEHLILMADTKRIKQVILNLLSNAVKFTPEGGTVILKVAKDSDSNLALIEVSDTGVGMAAQDLAKALSPFGQVDNSLSKRYEGTGLGLPLTKKLVELMKGKFDIKSEPGLGTTVTLKFSLVSNAIEEERATIPAKKN